MTDQVQANTFTSSAPTEREALLLKCLAEAMAANKSALTGVFGKDVKTIFFHGLQAMSADLLTVARALDASSDIEVSLMGSMVSAIQGRLDMSRELYEMVLHDEGTATRGTDRESRLGAELRADGAYPFGPSEAPPAPKEPPSAVRAAEPGVDDVLAGVDYARHCLELLIRETGPELARISVCECETTALALPESGALRHLRALELVSMALAHLQYAEESGTEQESGAGAA